MKGHWRIAALLAVAALLYVTYPSRVPECDAVIYASAALRGIREMMFYPAHLAFGSVEALAAAVGRMLRPALNPVDLLQYLSSAAALVGACFFYRSLVGLGVARGRAALFTGALAASYTWWHFALAAESHMIATALLMVFLRRTCEGLVEPGVRVWTAAGIWLGLATLMHQKGILMVGAALPALAWAVRDRRRAALLAASFLGAFSLVAIVPYLVVGPYVLGLRTAQDMALWIRGLETWELWGDWNSGTLPRTLVGITRSVLGSHFLLGFEPVRATATRLFRQASLEDELALAEVVPGPLRWVLLLVGAGVMGLVALAVLRRLARPWVAGAHGIPLTVFLWSWFVIAGVFAAWWAPVRAEFWLDVFPPLVALLALPARGAEGRAAGRRWVAVCALGLACVNFMGSIRPQSMDWIEPESAVALALDATVRPGESVLSDIPFRGRASIYARAFAPVDLRGIQAPPGIPTREARYRLVDSLLVAAERSGRNLYLAATPLRSGAEAKAELSRIVADLAERYEITESVPIRAAVDLRRVTRRRDVGP